eukprot:9478164-Pyramimonas_sp.AAC.1
MTDRELLTLRRALVPFRGGSLPARMLLYDDPAWKIAVAPVIQYCKAVWNSIVQPDRVVLSWRFLQQTWDAVASKFPVLQQSQWNKSAGPIHRAMLCLHRLGWTFTNFKTFFDDNQIEHDLFFTSPALLAKQLHASILRLHARSFAATLPQGQGQE